MRVLVGTEIVRGFAFTPSLRVRAAAAMIWSWGYEGGCLKTTIRSKRHVSYQASICSEISHTNRDRNTI